MADLKAVFLRKWKGRLFIMNGVSSVSVSAHSAVVKRPTVRTFSQVQFGDKSEEVTVLETSSRLVKALAAIGAEFKKAIPAAIVATVIAPLVHPVQEGAKRLFWNAGDSVPGVAGKKIRQGTQRVKKAFSRKTETLEEQLEEEAKVK